MDKHLADLKYSLAQLDHLLDPSRFQITNVPLASMLGNIRDALYALRQIATLLNERHIET